MNSLSIYSKHNMKNLFTPSLFTKGRLMKFNLILLLSFSLMSAQLSASENTFYSNGTGENLCDIELQLNATYETCVGSCDGHVSVNASGGAGGNTYLWSSGGDYVIEDNLCAGIYTVTVTDEEGCSAVGSIELELSPEGIWLMLSGTDPTCEGGNNGTAHVSVMTGVAPYTIVWSDGQMGEDITGLSPGTYSVTVTDVNGCSNTEEITIDEGTGTIELQLNASYETCVGSCDGNVSVNASGGSGGFTYLWNNGEDFVVVDDACAGIYTVTVTDDEGCSAVGSIELELSPEGIWLMTSGTDASCASANDGTAHVSVMTGVAPYTIVWSDGQMGEDITGLTPGTYSVTVTDANGCSNTEDVTIGAGQGAIDLQLNASYETCDGSCDGNVSVNASGGVEPYTYLWDDPNNTDFVVVDNLCAGTYTVTVTDANGCFAVGSIELELSPEGVWLMTSTTDVTCNGGSDGTAHVSVMAGTAPYDIVWSTNPVQTGEDATGLSAGTYTVTATDANGCSNTEEVTIGEPSAIEITINFVNDADCNVDNGSINIGVLGGNDPYTYAWSNGAITQDIENLAAGDYTVTVTDDNGCTAVEGPITINESSDLLITLENVTDATCGLDNGAINISVSGGTPGYTYVWSNGALTQDIDNLSAGDYSVTVTDAAGCTAVMGPITVNDSPAIVIAVEDVTDASCGASDGAINISVNGGTPGYTYVWSNGALTQDIDNLSAGDYSVTVTDAAGCTVVMGPITVEEEDCCEIPVVASVVVVEATCGDNNGSATIEMVGNNADFSFDWDPNIGTPNTDGNSRTDLPAGSYSVTITGDPNCPSIVEVFTIGNSNFPLVTIVTMTPASCGNSDGSVEMSEPGFEYLWCNGETVYNPMNLPAGSCVVMITDPSTGCTDFQTVVIEEDNGLVLGYTVNNYPDCGAANGSVTIDVGGGSGSYAYEWSNGNNTATADNLSSGSYCVTVTDNGPASCVDVICFVLTDNVIGATVIITEPVSSTCAGLDDATVVYNITYDPGFVDPPTIEIIDMNGVVQTNGNLSPGDYCIVVTDGNNCIAGQGCFEVTDPDQIDVDIAIDDSCPSPGISIVEVLGGNGGYTFLWSNGAVTQNITDLNPGTYGVTVTDINGCTAAANNLVITAECCIDFHVASVVIIEASCGNSDGSACIEMVGNNADYTFDWDPNIGTPNTIGNCRTDLPAGAYSVTITGDPDCPSIVETFTIGNRDFPPVVIITSTPATCEQPNGSIEMSEPGFEYLWCNGETGNNPMNLPAGPCVVQITDPATGCIDFQTVIIEEINPLVLDITVNNQPDCGIANGMVTVNASNGSGNYSYSWSNGEMTATIDGIASGNYCVTVTDMTSGCVKDTCFVLTDNVSCASIIIAGPVSTTCIGTDDGTVIFNTTYEPCFAFPATTQILDENGNPVTNGSLSPGSYCIVEIDANGCINASACFDVTEPDQIDMDIAIFNTCDPTPGIEIVSTTGGTAPYTYDWCDLPGSDNPEDRPDLESGTYCVTVTDTNGCTASANDLVVIDTCACPPMIISSVVVVESSCGTATGQATVTVFDAGTMNLSYNWNPAQPDQPSISGLPAGVYSVTITNIDQPNCNIIEEFSVGNSDGPEVSYTSTPSLCAAADGTVEFSEPSYNYDWAYGPGYQAVNVPAGTYFVTITDPANPDCEDIKTVVVEETPSFTASYSINTNPDCNESNGSVTISPAGDYSYSWGSSATMNDLSSGVYNVTVTDNATGCTSSVVFVLTDNVPNALITINGDAFISCPGNTDGFINYSITGGSGSYDVEILDINGNVQTNGQLGSGTYCIVATETSSGCIIGGECIDVKEPSQIDVDVAVYHEECGEPGEIQLVEVLGGNGGYMYSWSSPITTTDSVATDLGPGPYTFTVTDALGCLVSETVTVLDDPNALSILTSPDSTFCEASAVISVMANAGTFEWEDSDQNPLGDTPSITVDEAGTYYVTVTNGNCVETDSVIVAISPPSIPGIDIDLVECSDSAVLVLTDISTNPQSDITDWEWITSVGTYVDTNSITVAVTESQDIEVLLIITTEAGCMDTITEMIPVNLVNIEIADTTVCFGTTDVTLNLNGNPDLVYVWSPASAVDDVNSPNPIVTSDDDVIITVMVTDSMGLCSDTDTILYQVEDEIELFISSNPDFCTGGPVTLTASTTNADLIEWYDSPDFPQPPLGTGPVFEDAFPNAFDASEIITYYAVGSLNGCTTVDSIVPINYEVNFEILGPEVACAGDTILLELLFPEVTLLDGAIFEWSGPGDIQVQGNGEAIVVAEGGISTYSLLIDNNYCDGTNNFNISATDFSAFEATADPDTIFLSETSQLDVTGNDGLSYHWTSEDGIFESDEQSPVVQPEETTLYTVEITDDNECADIRTVVVTVTLPECEEPYIFFPNAFSPNGDGFNDVLLLRGQDVTEVFFAIYDRWGEKVFESNSQNIGWDGTFKGKELSSDVYGFYLRVRCGNGDEFYKQGNVTLFR